MKRFLPILLVAVTLPAWGQGAPATGQGTGNNAAPPPKAAASDEADSVSEASAPLPAKPLHGDTVDRQATIDRLTKTNQELLDLLKQQQAVLEDIQYDRRLQNRQIMLIEERLETTLQTNAALQAKIAKLEAEAVAAKSAGSQNSEASSPPAVPNKSTGAITNPAPAPPASSLRPPETEGASGTMWWHRIVTISGDDSKSSDTFHIAGKQWRVQWHNQDRPGDIYKNTSLLFINAFPKDDTIPKKVCSKLGSGGDSTELTGSGDYYLKVEASGGHWEAAVEDFR